MKEERDFAQTINTSIIFKLNPEKDNEQYNQVKNDLITLLYYYEVSISKENELYGYELFEAFNNCIKSFDPSKGEFLNYFNSAFKLEKSKSKSKDIVDEYSGSLHVSKRDRKSVSVINKFLSYNNEITLEMISSNVIYFADVLGMEEGRLRSALDIMTHSCAQSIDKSVSEENDETVADHMAAGGDFTEQIESEQAIIGLIDVLEEEYDMSRQNTKQLLSIKITSALSNWDGDNDLSDYFREKTFFHKQTYDFVLASGREIKNKDIGRSMHKSEANVSQIWKRFGERCKVKTGGRLLYSF